MLTASDFLLLVVEPILRLRSGTLEFYTFLVTERLLRRSVCTRVRQFPSPFVTWLLYVPNSPKQNKTEFHKVIGTPIIY